MYSMDKNIASINIANHLPSISLLHRAILSENINEIKEFLNTGVPFWVSDQNGETALDFAQKA